VILLVRTLLVRTFQILAATANLSVIILGIETLMSGREAFIGGLLIATPILTFLMLVISDENRVRMSTTLQRVNESSSIPVEKDPFASLPRLYIERLKAEQRRTIRQANRRE